MDDTIKVFLMDFVNLMQVCYGKGYKLKEVCDDVEGLTILEGPIIKVVAFLIRNRDYDYSKTDIAKGAGVSKTTLFKIWNILEELGLVVETRKVGRAKMYKLNEDNPIVQKFIELDNAISKYSKKLVDVKAK